jgi:CelD/BcsL family acetyltransferase involved in cellulose biosynthesis
MIQFAISEGLNVRNTFPHKDIHKERQYSADGRTVNQIGHVLISNIFRSATTDIQSLKGPDTGSQHNLMKINFKVKLRVNLEIYIKRKGRKEGRKKERKKERKKDDDNATS